MKFDLFDGFTWKCDFVTVRSRLDVLLLLITESFMCELTNPQLGLEL